MLLRVIAGNVAGHPGPWCHAHPDRCGACDFVARSVTDAAMAAGLQRARLYLGPVEGRSVAARRPISMGQLAVFGDGDTITIAADQTQETRSPTMDVLILRWPADQGAGRDVRPVRDDTKLKSCRRSRTIRRAGSAAFPQSMRSLQM